MHKRLILILIICLFFAIGSLVALIIHGPADPGGRKAFVRVGGAFSLVNHMGNPVTDKDFGKRKKLIYFGYTGNGSIMDQAALQVMGEVINSPGVDKDKLAVLFISIDPERDRPERLAEFLKQYHRDIVGLTGTVEAVEKVMKSYLVYSKKIKSEGTKGYVLQHSGHIYFMDHDNRYLAHFNHTNLPENIIKTILKYF